MLTLLPDAWYGWQSIPGNKPGSFPISYAPIRVRSVEPQKGARNLFQLQFVDAGDSTGIRERSLQLCVFDRGEGFIIGKVTEPGASSTQWAIITPVNEWWLRAHCPWLTSYLQPGEDPGTFLDRSLAVI